MSNRDRTGLGEGDSASRPIRREITTGKWAQKPSSRKIFGHGFMDWDPLVKWLLLTLVVATLLGYVMVLFIVLKVQEKGPWADDPDASPFFNRALTDQPSRGHLVDHNALDELLRSDGRKRVS